MLLLETLPSFFQMHKKLKTGQNMTLRDFIGSLLGDCIHVTFISQQLEPQKNLSDLKEFHILHRHLIIQVKDSYISNSNCVLFCENLFFLIKIYS